MTSAMPATSIAAGTWRSTSKPISEAVAGSSESISAKVARGNRAIAS